MRMLYLGDGKWATESLTRLVASGYSIVGVVVRTQPSDPHLIEQAQKLGLPVFQPHQINQESVVNQLRDMKFDLGVSVSYDQILRKSVLQTAPLGFINFHAGYLPFYRGRSIINWAVINGETEIGLTCHFIDEGIDTGDIVYQRTLPISWEDTYGSVLERVMAAFPDLVSKGVELVVTGAVERRPQNKLYGTYYASRDVGDEWLDWTDTSRNLYNKIRGISRPAPGARTLFGDQEYRIWRAWYDPEWVSYQATPGQVVGRVSGEGVLVKTGDSVLLVQEVQSIDGSPERPSWKIGSRLGVNLYAALSDIRMRLAELERKSKS